MTKQAAAVDEATTDDADGPSASKDGTPRFRWAKTLALCAANLGVGMSVSIYGPTLLDFARSLDVPLEIMTWMVTARSIGGLAGCTLEGYLANRFSVVLLLGIFLLLLGAGFIVLPWLGSYAVLMSFVTTLGICMGTVDPATTILILRLWKKQNGPYLQLVSFIFGFGGFVAPLLLTAPLKSARDIESELNTTAAYGNYTLNGTNGTSDLQPVDIVQVRFAFSIVGALVVASAFTFFALTCADYRSTGLRKSDDDGEKAKSVPKRGERSSRRLLLALLFVFYVLYVGTEVGFSSLVASFSATSTSLHFSQAKAAILTSVFWGMFTLGRLLGIPISHYVNSTVFIGVSYAICTVSSLALATLSEVHVTVLWIATATLGLGLGPIFPAGMTWASSKIHMGAKSTSLLMFGAALGEMTLPGAVGALMGRVGPRMLMWAIVVLTGLSDIVSVCLVILASRHNLTFKQVSTGIQSAGDANSTDDEENSDETKPSIRLNPLAMLT